MGSSSSICEWNWIHAAPHAEYTGSHGTAVTTTYNMLQAQCTRSVQWKATLPRPTKIRNTKAILHKCRSLQAVREFAAISA